MKAEGLVAVMREGNVDLALQAAVLMGLRALAELDEPGAKVTAIIRGVGTRVIARAKTFWED